MSPVLLNHLVTSSMNLLLQKCHRSASNACTILLQRHHKLNKDLFAAFTHTHVPRRENEVTPHTSKGGEGEGGGGGESESSVGIARAVCDTLRRGGGWDCLSASCNSTGLSDVTVEKVLLGLKEPVDAKRALLFFHWCTRQRRRQHGLRSYSLMVHILVRAGLVVDAAALLESAVRKDPEAIAETLRCTYELALPGPQVFDLLLVSFSKLRMVEKAIEVCRQLGEHGFLPTLATFNSLLYVVQRSEKFDMVWTVYEYMVVKRRYSNQATIEIMIGALCKGGALKNVVETLDRIHGKRCSPNVIVGTALALRIIEEDRSEEVIFLLKRMLQKNLILDDVAYSLTVYAYCEMGSLELAYKVFEEMLKRGHNANAFIYTLLIGRHCMEGRMKDAVHLMQEMFRAGLKPYDETYNVLIELSSRMGNADESLAFCTDMLGRGLLPSCVACNKMMSKLCQDGEVEMANKVFTVLLDKGFVPDEETYSKLIDGYGKKGNAQEILKLYYEMEGRGPSPGLSAYTSLVRSLCHCGKLKEAEKMASYMKEKSFATSEYIDSLLMKHSAGAHNSYLK